MKNGINTRQKQGAVREEPTDGAEKAQQNKGGPTLLRPCIAGEASVRSPRMSVC